MSMPWPDGFARIPDESWVRESIEALALHYDTVENHGWYANLDLTVEQVGDFVRRGDILVDYSGGTGIFARRLLDRIGSKSVGLIIVDSSPKFLRLAVEKFRHEPRLGFRHIGFLKDDRRLERVDEVLDEALLARGIDGVISTNAIHLYFDLPQTVRGWRTILRPSGRLFVQSGNIGNPHKPDDEWIIDETVDVIEARARDIVRQEAQYVRYRSALHDLAYMSAHDELRRRYFLPVRPLQYYVEILRQEGFDVTSVRRRRVPARVDEWYQFLSVYHEGVLGWVGGAEKITHVAAAEPVVQDRLALMRDAIERVFGGVSEFGASWTYITCDPRA